MDIRNSEAGTSSGWVRDMFEIRSGRVRLRWDHRSENDDAHHHGGRGPSRREAARAAKNVNLERSI